MNNFSEVSSLAELPPVGNFRTILFDLDGTVYIDGDPIPGAQEFIEECIAADCLVSYITNLSLFPKRHCLDSLERMGVSTLPRHILTAVDVLVSTLDGRVQGRNLGVYAEEHVRSRFAMEGYHVFDLNSGPADRPLDAIVVCQVRELRDGVGAHCEQAIADGAPIFASSVAGKMPTRISGVQSAGEVLNAVVGNYTGENAPEIVSCGKPSLFFSAAIDEHIELAEPVLVVGDSLLSDMALAHQNGWFGLLVGDRPEDKGARLPDYWTESLGTAS